MAFIVAKRDARPSTPKIYISEKAKTITFSTGFLRIYRIDPNKAKFIRLAYDPSTKELALEISGERKSQDESLKLSRPSKTTISCPVTPILTIFSVDVREISGTYKGRAISGPIKINGFSDNAFMLKTRLREI